MLVVEAEVAVLLVFSSETGKDLCLESTCHFADETEHLVLHAVHDQLLLWESSLLVC
jgi:hypothetical protein